MFRRRTRRSTDVSCPLLPPCPRMPSRRRRHIRPWRSPSPTRPSGIRRRAPQEVYFAYSPVRYFESTRSATELAASENPLMAPPDTVTAVSIAGATPPVIRLTCAEPDGVKLFTVMERPDCAAPLTL